MGLICGWCGEDTIADPCSECGHEDPGKPWVQRNVPQPTGNGNQRRLSRARKAIESRGERATIEALAEELQVSPRTVRRWREMAD